MKKIILVLMIFFLLQSIVFSQEDFNSLVIKTNDAIHAGKYIKAINYTNKMINVDPTNSLGYFYRAYAEGLKKNNTNFINIIDDYSSAIKYDNGSDKTLTVAYYTGRAYFRGKIEDYSGAISDYRQVIKIQEELNLRIDQSLVSIGCMFLKNKEYKNAIVEFDKSIKINNINPEAYMYRSRAKLELSLSMVNDCSDKKALVNAIKIIEDARKDLSIAKDQFLNNNDMSGYNEAMDYSKIIENTSELYKRHL